jgi:hypothetical protein
LQKFKPTPVPSFLPDVKYGSKILDMISSLIPGPLSIIFITLYFIFCLSGSILNFLIKLLGII